MKSKKPLVLGTLGAFVAIATSLFLFLPKGDPEKNCVFVSDEADTTSTYEISAVFAPTTNFVDFSTLISRAATPIKEELGANLPSAERKNSLGRGLSVVIADGDPKLVTHRVVHTAEGATEDMDIDRAITSVFGNFDLAASCAAGDLKLPDDQISTNAQTDMLKALKVAADQVSSAEHKSIYVLGNGLQTSGAILMQEEGTLPSNSSQAISMAKELFDRGEVPDLYGITVHWYGLGQVDGDNQKSLPLSKGKALETFWTQIITLAGGTVGDICAQCGSGVANVNAIPVDLIPVNECPLTVKLYDSDGVEFKPNSSDFVSPEKAKSAAIKTIADFTAKKGCESLTIRGVAAAGKNKKDYLNDRTNIDDTNKGLTKERAEKFGALLRASGFKGSLTYVGGGTCGTEWNAKGVVVPDLQRSCRRVEVY